MNRGPGVRALELEGEQLEGERDLRGMRLITGARDHMGSTVRAVHMIMGTMGGRNSGVTDEWTSTSLHTATMVFRGLAAQTRDTITTIEESGSMTKEMEGVGGVVIEIMSTNGIERDIKVDLGDMRRTIPVIDVGRPLLHGLGRGHGHGRGHVQEILTANDVEREVQRNPQQKKARSPSMKSHRASPSPMPSTYPNPMLHISQSRSRIAQRNGYLTSTSWTPDRHRRSHHRPCQHQMQTDNPVRHPQRNLYSNLRSIHQHLPVFQHLLLRVNDRRPHLLRRLQQMI